MNGIELWHGFLNFVRNNVLEFFAFLDYKFDFGGESFSILSLVLGGLVGLLLFALSLRLVHLVIG